MPKLEVFVGRIRVLSKDRLDFLEGTVLFWVVLKGIRDTWFFKPKGCTVSRHTQVPWHVLLPNPFLSPGS